MTDSSFLGISARLAAMEKRLEEFETKLAYNFGPRIRAHILTAFEYKEHSTDDQRSTVRAIYDGSEYTHVDVYSPIECGENLLYRVKL